MRAEKLTNAARILSFPSSVGLVKTEKEARMSGLNYSIKPLGDNQYYVSCRVNRNGKDYRKREKVEGKRAAEKRARLMVAELEEKAETDASSRDATSSLTTFSECVEYYKSFSESWWSGRRHLERVDKELGECNVSEIQEGYDRMYNYLKTQLSVRKTKYSSGTLNRLSQRVQAVISFCKEKEVINSSVTLKITKLKEVARDRVLTDKEVKSLFEAIDEFRPYLRPIIQFSIQVPSRKSELINLRRSDIDVVNQVVRIRIGTTKNGKGITKPIPPNMVDYFSVIPEESEFAFYREDKGEYKQLKSMRNAFDFVLDKAGINNFRHHDLRHISSSRLLHMGLTEREIMQIAGWKTNMLSTYYHKDSVEASKSAIRLMEKS